MATSGRVAGKVAIVTGGAGDIGAATVRLLVGEGAAVVIADRDDDAGRALAQELGPDRVVYVHLDVRDAEGWARAVHVCIDTFGPPTILVQIAGVMVPAILESATEEMYRLAFDVHVLGPLLGIQATLADMRSAGGGSIIIMSSAAGVHGVVGLAMYGASKAANAHLARTAALELGRYGIRVNAIAPGLIDTKMSRSVMPPSDGEDAVDDDTRLRQTAPGGRVGDVAPAVLYLASDESTFVTGTVIPIDGGLLAGIAAPMPGEE